MICYVLKPYFASVKQTRTSEVTVDKYIEHMEAIIYNKLRFRGFKVDVGVVESRGRDETGKEIRKQLKIGFIATKGSKNITSNQLMQFLMRRNTNREPHPLTKPMKQNMFKAI
ncbi:MAG: hypothetical protein PHD56_04340 [Anaerostipes sp.]|nr:hypothetical protein [Anaerostipes sp.]